MVKIFTNFQHSTELMDVAKLFYSEVEKADDILSAEISVVETQQDGKFEFSAEMGEICCKTSARIVGNKLLDTRYKKRYAKIALYRLLKQISGKSMPWGSLTGIRPTKLARQLIAEGADWQDTFANLFEVSQPKISLVEDILHQQGNLAVTNGKCADLYIGIPFCVSRCSYCSFTSGEIDRLKKYVGAYLDALCIDIRKTVKFAAEHDIAIKNVYFGGGTPTSLTAQQLDMVMSCIDFMPCEYTVEAGRPDTVTADKLDVLKSHGVHRISINPQSFNQSVLDVIDRKHSVDEIYKKYDLGQKYGFIINMDLIAGLPTETEEMFAYSLDEAVRLNPDNITVHTLALKHGSILKEAKYCGADLDVKRMVEYAHSTLYSNGYFPYYMYRQKYMSDNLENVGFCKPNTACAYNIGIMEEINNIMACGTGAISKRIFSAEDRIERAANAKDVITYINRTEDYISKKLELFSK